MKVVVEVFGEVVEKISFGIELGDFEFVFGGE